MINILTLNTTTNVFITLGIVVLLVGIFLLSHFINNKINGKAKPLVLGITYFFSFLSLVGATIGLLIIWNFPFDQYIFNVGADLLTSLENSVGQIVSSILLVFIALFLLKIIKLSISRIGNKPSPNQKRKKTIAKLTQSLFKYTIWLITILIVLSIWGVNVGPALAGLGIMGLVIGLGAQKFINDLISGLFIIFEQHFDVGDVIETNGFIGEVVDIGLKTTKLKNWKGELKILANGELTDVVNRSRYQSLAIIDFGVAYESDLDKVYEVIKENLPKMKTIFPEITEDPQLLGVTELANSSINLRVIARTLNNQHFNVERQGRAFIKKTLEENGIEIPFPQVVVHEAKK